LQVGASGWSYPSWAGVEDRLAAAGAARVDDWEATVPWRYRRFRDPPYDEAAPAYALRLLELCQGGAPP